MSKIDIFLYVVIAIKSSLISLNQVNTRHKIYFCKTYHSRFWPVKHSFKYPVLFVGVDLDILEQQQYKKDGHSLFDIGYNNSSIIFNINDDDYLGKINSGDDNLENPRNNELKVVILEINNTFGEKHLHVLSRDTVTDQESRNGYDMSFTMKRAFHVSPFNDRLGTYKMLCKDPSSGYLDMRIVMYAGQDNKSQLKKKMVATVSGPSYILSMNSLLYAIIRYPFDIFLTFPRILKEAYKLHYSKKLGIYHRPIPIEGTVVKLEPNSIELHAQEIITSYLRYLIESSLESTYITINLPDKNKLPIIIRPSNLPIISFSNTITINLHDYSFFTNLLINQNIYRALLISYFEKSWDCDELGLLLKLFFNNRLDIENKVDNKKEPLHRDYKIKLSNFENRISILRRWYWKKSFNNQESSGERAKKEFDQLLQKMWPPIGVDRDFIASIVQNDVCFDIRLDATINSHEEVAVALRDLFAINSEGNTIALFGYTHLYMLSPFTFPSSATISNISPIIASKLHLLPFPPRYLAYENKEPLKHPIDKFIHSSKLFTNKDKLKYTWMMLLMVLGYSFDAGFWQMITGFIEGPRGNLYFAEKWLWEGISDIESDNSISIKSSNEERKKQVFDGWEVVYERIGNNDKLQKVKPTPTPSLPSPSTKPTEVNPMIEEDKQQRLWLFTKIFREVILLRTD
ncbi:18567_t:CDS:2 [Rhizophagus irregularis]|nr:18567_t:CDS:2 [Rhizophagus irregularis]